MHFLYALGLLVAVSTTAHAAHLRDRSIAIRAHRELARRSPPYMVPGTAHNSPNHKKKKRDSTKTCKTRPTSTATSSSATLTTSRSTTTAHTSSAASASATVRIGVINFSASSACGSIGATSTSICLY